MSALLRDPGDSSESQSEVEELTFEDLEEFTKTFRDKSADARLN